MALLWEYPSFYSIILATQFHHKLGSYKATRLTEAPDSNRPYNADNGTPGSSNRAEFLIKLDSYVHIVSICFIDLEQNFLYFSSPGSLLLAGR